MHPCVVQVNADCSFTGDPPRNVHYFHMFPREDIQTRSFHCPVEDGAAVDKTLQWNCQMVCSCCYFVWRALDGMEWLLTIGNLNFGC